MKNKEVTANPLDALMASGTVLGICLIKRGEILQENFPCSAPSLVKICRVIDGLTKECKIQGRQVDQMAFGYNGGNLLALTIGEHRLVIMHLMTDEIDFLAKTARAYLKDIINPPDSAQVALDQQELKDYHVEVVTKEEADPRAELLPENLATFDDSANNLIAENMSVEDLIHFFATQLKAK